VAGSEKKVWWQCPNGNDHVWQATLVNRTRLQRGCPMCAGKQVVKSTSLAYRYPELARQWHPTKNGGLTPQTVYASSHKAIWWQCLTVIDHVWSANISDRLQNEKFLCPFCSHQRLHPTNSLANFNPELAAQWHPTKNGSLTPDQVVAGSEKKVWWKY
jgi:Probable Zinc-ribbon domain